MRYVRPIGLAVTLIVAAAAAAANPTTGSGGRAATCAEFKTHLSQARAEIGLPLPAAEYEREKSAGGPVERWYVNNLEGHMAILECSPGGGFRSFQLDIIVDPADEDAWRQPVSTMDIVTAALHAYAGEPASRVLAWWDVLVDKAWREARRAGTQRDEVWTVEIGLANGATASLSGGEGLMFRLVAGGAE